jgi:hypothetical protein
MEKVHIKRMNTNSENPICEDIRALGSAGLDGVLPREESQKFFDHLKTCADCRDYMTEMTRLESDLVGFSAVYDRMNPDKDINQKVRQGIAKLKSDDRSFKSNAQFRKDRSFKPMFAGGLVGAVAAVLLVVFIMPVTLKQTDMTAPRFQLQPIAFHETKDKVEWDGTHTLQPGQVLKHRVLKGHKDAYHFRLKSSGPVNIVIGHNDAESDTESLHQVSLQGVHYATLKQPKANDVIFIRNEGDEPIEINSFTQGKPEALHSEMTAT